MVFERRSSYRFTFESVSDPAYGPVGALTIPKWLPPQARASPGAPVGVWGGLSYGVTGLACLRIDHPSVRLPVQKGRERAWVYDPARRRQFAS